MELDIVTRTHTQTHIYPQTTFYWDLDFFLQSHPAIGNEPGLAYWDIFYNLYYWELCVLKSHLQQRIVTFFFQTHIECVS